MNLKNYLPYGVQIAKDGGNGVALVTAYIEPVFSMDFKVMAENISIYNVPEGWKAQIEAPYLVYDLRVEGLEKNVRSIEEASLRGSVDVEAWLEENDREKPEAESFYIPVEMILPESVTISVPVEARVTFLPVNGLEGLQE